jgi:tRNA-2-methylthio-N6-dimethylallyladenosine synthase
MNRHDAEALAGLLVREGHEPAASPEEAEVVIYFTCSVREHAEDRVWSHLGRWRLPRTRGLVRALGVVGCMSERLGEAILRRMPHVDFVVGPRRLAETAGLVRNALAGAGGAVATGAPSSGDGCLDAAGAVRPRPFQAYLAVMRGCDCGCAYCVVPRVRGREESRPPAEVEETARRLVDEGVREITLLGQNIDRYGRGLSPRTSLAALLRRLSGIPGLARLRFVTSHPRDITEGLLRAMAECETVMPYLHVPAQSGSDRILRAMRRRYTRARYEAVLASARGTVPGLGIASDFIVGFPGETERDFEETLSLVRGASFQNAFVFKYSPRPGTPAGALPDDVPDKVKRERHRLLSEAQKETSLALNRGLVGSGVEVLAEGRSRTDRARWAGRTPSFRIAAFRSAGDPTGRIVRVRVEDATPLVLLGNEV